MVLVLLSDAVPWRRDTDGILLEQTLRDTNSLLLFERVISPSEELWAVHSCPRSNSRGVPVGLWATSSMIPTMLKPKSATSVQSFYNTPISPSISDDAVEEFGDEDGHSFFH